MKWLFHGTAAPVQKYGPYVKSDSSVRTLEKGPAYCTCTPDCFRENEIRILKGENQIEPSPFSLFSVGNEDSQYFYMKSSGGLMYEKCFCAIWSEKKQNNDAV